MIFIDNSVMPILVNVRNIQQFFEAVAGPRPLPVNPWPAASALNMVNSGQLHGVVVHAVPTVASWFQQVGGRG